MKAIALLLVAWTGAAAGQPLDPCMKAYNDEIVAIEHEAKTKQNTGSEAAKQRAARAGQARLGAAARSTRRSRACGGRKRSASRPS